MKYFVCSVCEIPFNSLLDIYLLNDKKVCLKCTENDSKTLLSSTKDKINFEKLEKDIGTSIYRIDRITKIIQDDCVELINFNYTLRNRFIKINYSSKCVVCNDKLVRLSQFCKRCIMYNIKILNCDYCEKQFLTMVNRKLCVGCVSFLNSAYGADRKLTS
jgi:hypothetical protein